MSPAPAHDGRTPSVGCTFVGLGILAAGVAAVFAVGTLTGDDAGSPASLSPTSTTLPSVTTTEAPKETDVDEPAPVRVEVDEYAVTYRVETFSAGTVLIDTEVRRHRFPFDAEILTFASEPDDVAADDDRSAATERSAYVMGGFETGTPGQSQTVLSIVPGIASRLGHFGGDLSRAVDEGLVEHTGRRLAVAGRDCDVYRTRSPLDVVRLEPPTADDHTDLCIAPDGLVLREVWHRKGELFRRRTAIDVEEAAVPAERFELVGFRIPDANGGGRVRRLLPDSTAPGVPHLLPRSLPDGFESIGRFVYVADSLESDVASAGIERIVSLVDVFVSSDHVLVVENGGTLSGAAPAGEGGIPVDVPGHPEAQGTLFSHQSEVFVPTDGRFVRLSSTLPLDQLVQLAGELQDHPGSGQVIPASDALDITGRVSPEDLESHEHDEVTDDEHTHDGSTHTHG